MAPDPKFAGLPGVLDGEEPNLYETPEPDLTDDASTAKTTTFASTPPPFSEANDASDDEREQAISHQRLHQDAARTRFEPSQVDARGVDFSDRLDSAHGSYRTSTRRRRRRSKGGTEFLGDISDDEQETVQLRLIRLRKEAEELRQQIEEADQEAENEGDVKDELDALNSMLNGLKAPSQTQGTAQERLLLSLSTPPNTTKPTTPAPAHRTSSAGEAPDPDPASSYAAATKLSDRLAALETSLGLDTSSPSSTLTILPTLSSLTSQITTLSSTLIPASDSLSNSPSIRLDELSNRIRTLVHESERLTTSRKAATAAALELHNARATAAAAGPGSHADQLTAEGRVQTATAGANANISLSVLDDQTTKIRSLYTTLPTISSLHPLLPTVLERLRSLAGVHAGAAQAAADLDAVEKRQVELDEEIQKWREGLERAEEKMGQAEGVMKGNMEVLGSRLGEVEERFEKLR